VRGEKLLSPTVLPQTLRPRSLSSPRVVVLVAIAVAGLGAAGALHLDLCQLLPGPGGIEVAKDFFSRALSPAWTYESGAVIEGAAPLPLKALAAARQTVIFAAAAMSLAILIGLPLGFIASAAWWEQDPVLGEAGGRWRRSFVATGLHGGSRIFIALMRSIHELLWAVLFLAAFGLSHLSAVVAIAIPFGGTLAKVFSEMIDEAPRDSAEALRGVGASQIQVFLFGLLPRALPDFGAYTFYRFECALRSSAILGFFGFPTLGYYIAASFENLYYGEVWTYLYTLFLLVALTDWWSGALRRRLVAR